MARIISTCGSCGTKMIRDYFEASAAPAQFWKGQRVQTSVWYRADTNDRACLAYEQNGCGMCRWHPQGCNGLCPNCAMPMQHKFTSKEIKVTHSDRVKCGASCHTAISDTCTCECDGMNHGKALRLQIEVLA